jgi:hypothetical protein
MGLVAAPNSALRTHPAPVTTAEVPDATGASDHAYGLGNIGQPAFFGLIAFVFLIMAAWASAHEKKGPKSSRRPPRAAG